MAERKDGISPPVDRRARGCSYLPLRYNGRDRGDKESGCTHYDLREDFVLPECSRNDVSEGYVPGFLFRDLEVHRRRGLCA